MCVHVYLFHTCTPRNNPLSIGATASLLKNTQTFYKRPNFAALALLVIEKG